MLVWFIYDIVSNKKRRDIVKLCKRNGLIRVQKSVFLGNIDETKLKAITAESEENIDKAYSSYLYDPHRPPG